MEERILTLHPDPLKTGVNIERKKYEQVYSAILEALQQEGALTFTQLCTSVEKLIGNGFQGSLNWYIVSVKLDLEARSVIERLPGRPHRMRIKI